MAIVSSSLALVPGPVSSAITPNILSTDAYEDVSEYLSFVTQIVSTGISGTFIFEGSNDGVNFQVIPVCNISVAVRAIIATTITASTSVYLYEGACSFKYLRCRIATTITGGTLTAWTNPRRNPLASPNQYISNSAGLSVSMAGGYTSIAPSATYGYTTFFKLVCVATTNATLVKSSPGTIGSIICGNMSSNNRILKLYNKASAPTVGTDIPVMAIVIPQYTSRIIENAAGLRFSTGIAFAVVAGIQDSDTTAIAVNEIVINITYV